MISPYCLCCCFHSPHLYFFLLISTFKSPFRTPLIPNSAPPTARFSSSNSLLKSQLQNRVYPPASKPSPSPSVKTGIRSISVPGVIQSIPPTSLPRKFRVGDANRVLTPFPAVASSSKLSLASSGLRPQDYSREELEEMGLYALLLLQRTSSY